MVFRYNNYYSDRSMHTCMQMAYDALANPALFERLSKIMINSVMGSYEVLSVPKIL